jgi:hypothetical protein
MTNEERAQTTRRGATALFGIAAVLVLFQAGKRWRAGKHSGARDGRKQAVPALPAGAAQMSFAAAGDQLNALRRLRFEGPNEAEALAQRRNLYQRTFISGGAIELDSSGAIRSILEERRAIEAIQKKAAALGYGEQATVSFLSVAGGYVGRYGGHDIYAAAR